MSDIKEAIRETFEPRTVEQLYVFAIIQKVGNRVPDAEEGEVTAAVDEMVAEGELEYVDDDKQLVRWLE